MFTAAAILTLRCLAVNPGGEEPTVVLVRPASIYERAIPQTDEGVLAASGEITLTLWRNELGSAKVLVRSATELRSVQVRVSNLVNGQKDSRLPGELVRVRRVRTVNAGEYGSVPDPLEDFETLDLPAGETQALWLSLRVPPKARPGTYTGAVSVMYGREQTVQVPMRVEVLPLSLPPPEEYAFWLDLWQHPAAVARVHDLPLWSESHWTVLADTLRMLAEAGQKVITATIIHDPWGSQTYDPHVSMVTWYREEDGSLGFDFSIFDRYVETCMDAGIRERVHCYSTSLGPGPRTDCIFRVTDRATGRTEDITTQVGDQTYREMWKQFFEAFVPHLRGRGWREKTGIGMDEKPPEVMNPMLEMLREFAPQLSVALAGSYHSELDEQIRDYCIFYSRTMPDVGEARRKAGRTTTFYTCCGPASPNTFTHSPPVESRQLAWHAAASDLDGYLRWAYNAWNRAPLEDAAFGRWPPGDCFLIYPGPRSSIRFELLRHGIQDYEALQSVRSLVPQQSPFRAGDLEAAVRLAADDIEDEAEAARRVEEARALVNTFALRFKGR